MRPPALLLILTLAAASEAAAQTQDAARGEALVRRHCAICHAVGQSGDSPNPAAPRFRELHRRYNIDTLAEALSEGMLKGHPAMPQFQFAPNDVQAIIAYLKSIQTHQDVALPHTPAP